MSDSIDKYGTCELKVIHNVVDKINAYMAKNNITLFTMAQTLGFSYQPFYRLSKNKTQSST